MSKRTIIGYVNYGKCAVCKFWNGERDYSPSRGVTFDTNDEGKCSCGGKLESRFGMTRAEDSCHKWKSIDN